MKTTHIDLGVEHEIQTTNEEITPLEENFFWRNYPVLIWVAFSFFIISILLK